MSEVTRRGVIGGTVAGVATLPLASPTLAQSTPAPSALPKSLPVRTPDMLDVTLHVNGKRLPLSIDPRTSLLDALREHAGLTGTKKGCDHGSCGACTVHLDGERIVSCLALAARCQGHTITTVEGLARGDALHPMQAAFLHYDAFQCGYCTPGQIMSAVALLGEGHTGSDEEIREWMSGNICRCGAYPNIVAAIQDAAGKA